MWPSRTLASDKVKCVVLFSFNAASTSLRRRVEEVRKARARAKQTMPMRCLRCIGFRCWGDCVECEWWVGLC